MKNECGRKKVVADGQAARLRENLHESDAPRRQAATRHRRDRPMLAYHIRNVRRDGDSEDTENDGTGTAISIGIEEGESHKTRPDFYSRMEAVNGALSFATLSKGHGLQHTVSCSCLAYVR